MKDKKMKPSLKQVWNEDDLFVMDDIENPGQGGFWLALFISILLIIVALPIWTKREALRDFYMERSFPCEIIDKNQVILQAVLGLYVEQNRIKEFTQLILT